MSTTSSLPPSRTIRWMWSTSRTNGRSGAFVRYSHFDPKLQASMPPDTRLRPVLAGVFPPSMRWASIPTPSSSTLSSSTQLTSEPSLYLRKISRSTTCCQSRRTTWFATFRSSVGRILVLGSWSTPRSSLRSRSSFLRRVRQGGWIGGAKRSTAQS